MAIAELQNFRKKYPQYDDIDDATLANKLANKYPDAYSDLPERLNVIAPQSQKRKDVIDAFTGGKERIPEQNWMARGLYQTGKDIATIPYHFTNQLLANYPRSFARQGGLDYPEAESMAGQLASKTAGVIGGFKNPLIKAASGAKTVVGAAVRGGAVGAAYAPTEDIIGVKERATQAITGAAIPAVGGAAYKTLAAIPNVAKQGAARTINSLIKPLKKDFSYGKNPGLGVAREKIVANNFDELIDKLGQKKSEIGQKINTTLSSKENAIKRINIEDATSPIDRAMETAAKQNNQTLIDRLDNVKKAITRNLVLGKDQSGKNVIQTTGDRNLAELSPLEATKIKTEIGDLTKWTGNHTDDQLVNKALKETYGNIKNKIGQSVPEIKDLNERYANILTAEVAAKYRDQILQRQNLIGFGPTVAGGMGALVGSQFGGTPQTIIAGIGAVGLSKVLGSTALKTRVASALSKLSEVERNKVIQKIPKLKNLALKELRKPYAKGGVNLKSSRGSTSPSNEDEMRSMIEKLGGKNIKITDMKNSIYENEPTIYFDTPEGSTKTIRPSQLSEENIKSKIPQKSYIPPEIKSITDDPILQSALYKQQTLKQLENIKKSAIKSGNKSLLEKTEKKIRDRTLTRQEVNALIQYQE